MNYFIVLKKVEISNKERNNKDDSAKKDAIKEIAEYKKSISNPKPFEKINLSQLDTLQTKTSVQSSKSQVSNEEDENNIFNILRRKIKEKQLQQQYKETKQHFQPQQKQQSQNNHQQIQQVITHVPIAGDNVAKVHERSDKMRSGERISEINEVKAGTDDEKTDTNDDDSNIYGDESFENDITDVNKNNGDNDDSNKQDHLTHNSHHHMNLRSSKSDHSLRDIVDDDEGVGENNDAIYGDNDNDGGLKKNLVFTQMPNEGLDNGLMADGGAFKQQGKD